MIRALKQLATQGPTRRIVQRELGYFCNQRKRMHDADLGARGFMIGSGVVEATCKTLVAQRLKRSGRRWSVAGAHALLTPRG